MQVASPIGEAIERAFEKAIHDADTVMRGASEEGLQGALLYYDREKPSDIGVTFGPTIRVLIRSELRRRGHAIPFISYVPRTPAVIPAGETEP